jgi:hypothetical protein
LVGCLLHPLRNRGRDLRYRVDYGDKCRREVCQESKVFSQLRLDCRKYWLHLAEGLDAFSYSSRKMNPLFTLLNWGVELLQKISQQEKGGAQHWPAFLKAYPFFSTSLLPKGNAYLINELVRRGGLIFLKASRFRYAFERFSERLAEEVRDPGRRMEGGPHVHQLGLDSAYLDFLRLRIGIRRLTEESALRLKAEVDRRLDIFYDALKSRL